MCDLSSIIFDITSFTKCTFPESKLSNLDFSISIVFDEGTDQGQGFVYLDNIDINGTLIGKPGNTK